MKMVVAVWAVCLLSTAAAAEVDPGTDSFGVYFDVDNSTNCTYVDFYAPFNVYLVLMNPSVATNGFGCTITTSGSGPYQLLQTTLAGAGAGDFDLSVNGFIVSADGSYPVVAGGCLLVTWVYTMTGPGPLEFKIGRAPIDLGLGELPFARGEGMLARPCQVSSGSVQLPCAAVNPASCPVLIQTESSTFGSVKSLFR